MGTHLCPLGRKADDCCCGCRVPVHLSHVCPFFVAAGRRKHLCRYLRFLTSGLTPVRCSRPSSTAVTISSGCVSLKPPLRARHDAVRHAPTMTTSSGLGARVLLSWEPVVCGLTCTDQKGRIGSQA